MSPEAQAQLAPACEPKTSHHPLEIIPYFRRFRPSHGRDVLYTFIWNCLLGVAFWMIAIIMNARNFTFETLLLNLLVANSIGYVIHLLFFVGDALGIDRWARSAGSVVTTVYYIVVSTAGVVGGFAVVLAFMDQETYYNWLRNPMWLATMTAASFVISIILSVIFFWRARHAQAEAELERQRLRAERVEREAVLANLRALQAQIEPHFLFNTLANVTSLVDADPAKAKRMLESFIRFLRASLGATRSEATTLADESELIAAYLDVLEIRMGSRLRYTIDVPADLHGFSIPPMLLQPVVENAIRHGLEPKVDGGNVAFRARREGSDVVIEVSDTGVGFSSTTRGGVGLTNLRDRLRAIYGERATLAVRDNLPAGATVALRLPG